MSNSDIPQFVFQKSGPHSPDALNYIDHESVTQLSELMIHAIGYHDKLDDWSYPDVFGNFWRLYFNAKEGKSIISGQHRIDLNEKSIVLVPPQLLFSCHSLSITDHFWIHFSLPVQWRVSNAYPVSIPLDVSTEHLLNKLRVKTQTFSENQRLSKSLHSHALIYSVLSKLNLPEPSSHFPHLLQEALQLIKTYQSKGMSVAKIAKELHTSERNLRRMFTTHLGISPSDYILGTRMSKAATLLNENVLSIDQIAEETGFADRFHFSKVFRNHLGKTPVQFRKSN